MKIIVAGSRTFDDYRLLESKLDYLFQNIHPVIICGEAKGADLLGKKYAREKGLECISFPAKWEEDGKSAGYKRNELMGQIADGLVAFWDRKSKGTKHMIEYMLSLGKEVRIIKYK